MERVPQFKPCSAWVSGESFVQIMDVSLQGKLNEFFIKIDVINRHNITLKTLTYEANFYDSLGNSLNGENAVIITSEDVFIEPGETTVVDMRNISNEYPQARFASVKLLKAQFDDGNSLDLIYDNMEEVVFESLSPENMRLLQEYAGKDAKNLYQEKSFFWRCVCGYFNEKNSSMCIHCNREREDLKINCSDLMMLKGQLDKVLDKEVLEISEMLEELPEDLENISVEDLSNIIEKEKDNIYYHEKEALKEETGIISIGEYLKETPKISILMKVVSGILIIASILILISTRI